jgi:cytochrome c oxidase subunit II
MKSSAWLVLLGMALVIASLLPWPIRADDAEANQEAAAVHMDDVVYGQQLFVAKGCIGCHHHAAFAAQSPFWSPGGPPDLSNVTFTADYLRQWLRDPKAIKPRTEMPNLKLDDAEIEALTAFLSSRQ